MKKTLILVVDRDDDFGAKGHVETPVIGLDGCIGAATALGSADPEDSDTNALYAAINIYRDLEQTAEEIPEIALICGDQKVGHRSDTALVGELNKVLDQIKPDRAILCGDGAEDEYVYPIVSSRVPIDSVRKVYVKQAPGVEGTFYIINKTLNDPQKRERFLAPLSWVIVLISLVYMFANIFRADDLINWFLGSTTSIIMFIIGMLMLLYSYNMFERGRAQADKWAARAKAGSLSVIFLIASALFVMFGFVVGGYSLNDIHTTSTAQTVSWFIYNSIWLILFGIMFYLTGDMLDRYFSNKKVKYSTITYCLDILAAGLLITAFLDLLQSYMGLYHVNPLIYSLEFTAGIVTSVIAAALQRWMQKLRGRSREEQSREVQ
ncbi:MAG: DUF373 family protein [Candidatus Methanomethylophilus sp.]|nr:DUF373 family protein [Methanomethylophilus sp.]